MSQESPFSPCPNAPKAPLFLPIFTLNLRNRTVFRPKHPALTLVLRCQAFFLTRSSQPPDSKPNRVFAPVRGSPPPICYPEYRASSFPSRTKPGGLHPPAFGECGNAASQGNCGFQSPELPCFQIFTAKYKGEGEEVPYFPQTLDRDLRKSKVLIKLPS